MPFDIYYLMPESTRSMSKIDLEVPRNGMSAKILSSTAFQLGTNIAKR